MLLVPGLAALRSGPSVYPCDLGTELRAPVQTVTYNEAAASFEIEYVLLEERRIERLQLRRLCLHVHRTQTLTVS